MISYQALDHIQISIPKGRLELALEFYCGLMQMQRIPKPEVFASHGGAWLNAGGFSVHLGEEEHFATDGRAHPAFRVQGIEPLLAAAQQAGFKTRTDVGLAGTRRASVYDPFGNRIELIEQVTP